MGQKVMQPRLVAYMADHEELAYTYSHTKQRVLPWTPAVEEIKVRSSQAIMRQVLPLRYPNLLGFKIYKVSLSHDVRGCQFY